MAFDLMAGWLDAWICGGVRVILDDRNFAAVAEVRQLRKVFRHAGIDCVLDVGANAGQYARMLRRRVGFRGLIVSFEPNPDLIPLLQRAARDDGNWIVKNVALSDRDGVASFNIMAENQFSSLQSPKDSEFPSLSYANRVEKRVQVECLRLDGIFDDLVGKSGCSRVFLKMDTQGHDLSVFAGAAGVMERIRALQSEISFKRIYEGAPLYHEVMDTYCRHGFDLCGLFPNNAGHFPALVEMDCVMLRRTLP